MLTAVHRRFCTVDAVLSGLSFPRAWRTDLASDCFEYRPTKGSISSYRAKQTTTPQSADTTGLQSRSTNWLLCHASCMRLDYHGEVSSFRWTHGLHQTHHYHAIVWKRCEVHCTSLELGWQDAAPFYSSCRSALKVPFDGQSMCSATISPVIPTLHVQSCWIPSDE